MSRDRAWGDYWAGGFLTTFGDKPTYQGGLRELWSELFSALPDGAVIVDLGAGNGALAEIARQCCAERKVSAHVHAIDFAALRPPIKPADDGSFNVTWHARTRNEATGLDPHCADAITGNFAFEYGDHAATINEIVRLLKPGARCRLLMHHADSIVITDSRGELDVLECILGKGGLFDEVELFLREHGNIRKPGQFDKLTKSSAGIRHLRQIQEQHRLASERAQTPNAQKLLLRVTQDLNRLISPPLLFQPRAELLVHLQRARRAFAANRSRLDHMQHAALNQADAEKLLDAFNSAGLKTDIEPFFLDTHVGVVGWKLDAYA